MKFIQILILVVFINFIYGDDNLMSSSGQCIHRAGNGVQMSSPQACYSGGISKCTARDYAWYARFRIKDNCSNQVIGRCGNREVCFEENRNVNNKDGAWYDKQLWLEQDMSDLGGQWRFFRLQDEAELCLTPSDQGRVYLDKCNYDSTNQLFLPVMDLNDRAYIDRNLDIVRRLPAFWIQKKAQAAKDEIDRQAREAEARKKAAEEEKKKAEEAEAKKKAEEAAKKKAAEEAQKKKAEEEAKKKAEEEAKKKAEEAAKKKAAEDAKYKGKNCKPAGLQKITSKAKRLK